MDEQQLIQNPEALLALNQRAVQYLIEQRPDTAEQEAQLRAVAKAIEQLEKQRGAGSRQLAANENGTGSQNRPAKSV